MELPATWDLGGEIVVRNQSKTVLKMDRFPRIPMRAQVEDGSMRAGVNNSVRARIPQSGLNSC